MENLYTDLKTKKWDKLNKEIPLIKLYINVIYEKIHINIINLFLFKNTKYEIKNNFDMSLLNLVGNPYKKIAIFELSLFDKNINNCDILLGFLPNINSKQETHVKILLEPIKKSFFSSNNYIELTTMIKNNSFTPFLYGTNPFPKISFIDYNVKIIPYDSKISEAYPIILCANIQSNERKELIRSNIYTSFKELLFPKLNNNFGNNNLCQNIILPNINNI
jgi:hypothetical protein